MHVEKKQWQAGHAPIAVIMISLNEAHNMEAVLDNLKGWAQEVFLVDSCSADDTVDIALRYGVHVVQHQFKGFGDQWNFALQNLPITAPWTMKLDPDERLSDYLKSSLIASCSATLADGLVLQRRLFFMGSPLPVLQKILRVWRSGSCKFTDVAVNEHPMVEGELETVSGNMEHHDSPDLDHWVIKQNRYTTAEALIQSSRLALAAEPRLWGNALERRMWFKRNFWKFPGRYVLLFLYHLLVFGAWRAGKVGWIWSHLRTEVYRQIEYKCYEIEKTNQLPAPARITTQAGGRHPVQ